jgi:hypothetical protein
MNYQQAIAVIESRMLDWWGYRQEGQIDAVAPNRFESAATGAFDGFTVGQKIITRTGCGVNNLKQYTILSVNLTAFPRYITVVEGTVSTETGNGDEAIVAYYTPVMLSTLASQMWVVGTLPEKTPYAVLNLVGTSAREYENVGGRVNHKTDGILEIALYVPESYRLQPSVPVLIDAVVTLYRGYYSPPLLFQGEHRLRQMAVKSDDTKTRWRRHNFEFDFWWTEEPVYP